MQMVKVLVRPRRRLDRKDWAVEALAALSRGGVAGVAVEPIAQRLGATKGSFYHHFTNRDDLLEAALELWEQEHTVAVNADVDAASDDPRERLYLLIKAAIRMAETDPIGLKLLASADHPLVAPALKRVTASRLDYLTRLYGQMGQPKPAARRRALLTYSTYLGHIQLAHSTPSALPQTHAARHAYLDLVVASLLGPQD
jgi:AcrR family transcriptional regulator